MDSQELLVSEARKDTSDDQPISIESVFLHKISFNSSIRNEEVDEVIFIFVEWDDVKGPVLRKYHSEYLDGTELQKIGSQLYSSIVAIYGHGNIIKARSALFDVVNIGKQAFLYFDSFDNPSCRSGQTEYMFAILSPNISHLDCDHLWNVFERTSRFIKEDDIWDGKTVWNDLVGILTNPKSMYLRDLYDSPSI